MYDTPQFIPAGDQALLVEVSDRVDPDDNRRVHDLVREIEGQGVRGVVDLIPTYRSLLIQYDSMLTSYDDLRKQVEEIEKGMDDTAPESPRIVHIPVLYGGDFGPDLGLVAEQAGLTEDDVVSLHSGVDYLVYMMGFTPGFPYLGGLDDKLATPRRATPRPRTPIGSVGIAEGQTGVYPVTSPGGWQLIGRTPVNLFDADREPPSLLNAGDYVRFSPLTGEEEYAGIAAQAEMGEYSVTTTAMP